MPFQLTILGTSSATPTLSRRPSAQALSFNNRTFLIDCGEGTQLQCLKFGVKIFKIERIFISHLHADHCLGLLGLLSTLSLKNREDELTIYGPHGIQEMIEVQSRLAEAYIPFPIHYQTLEDDGLHLIYEDKYIEVKSIPLQHRIPCWGFIFKERQPYRKINKELTTKLNVPIAAFKELVYGKDYTSPEGEVYSAQKLTLGKPIHSYAYITDTLFLENAAKELKGIDTIYHEATFMNDKKEKAIVNFHSTSGEAGKFAAIAQTKQLIIGHFSARYNDLNPLLEEAKAEFENTLLAEEGKIYQI